MTFGRFESTPYIRSRVFESLLAFQTQVNDPDTAYWSIGGDWLQKLIFMFPDKPIVVLFWSGVFIANSDPIFSNDKEEVYTVKEVLSVNAMVIL
jgi:hypothetical protein